MNWERVELDGASFENCDLSRDRFYCNQLKETRIVDSVLNFRKIGGPDFRDSSIINCKIVTNVMEMLAFSGGHFLNTDVAFYGEDNRCVWVKFVDGAIIENAKFARGEGKDEKNDLNFYKLEFLGVELRGPLTIKGVIIVGLHFNNPIFNEEGYLDFVDCVNLGATTFENMPFDRIRWRSRGD